MFKPIFRLTGKITKALMALEADRQLVANLPLTVPMLDSLRGSARLLSTHFSTQIEGNRLTPSQVEAVIEGQAPVLRSLSPQQRHALGLLRPIRIVTAKQLASYFKCSTRTAATLCRHWVKAGFLVVENASTKARCYRLADV